MAGTIIGVIGAGAGAAGTEKERQEKKYLGEYNAQIAEYQALDAIERGKEKVKKQYRIINQTIGQQRASFAAQGVELDSGSALDVQLDTAGLGAEDIVAIENNAAMEAWGYRVQKQNYRRGVKFADTEADARQTENVLTAAGLLYQGLSN